MADPDLPPTLPGVPALELRLIRPDERVRFDQELCAHHYLHNATLVGDTLRYVAVAPDGRWLALLGWASPALHLRPRDRWLGWSEPQRAAPLCLIAQNSRFLLLTERNHYPNLASHLLTRCTRRLAADWLAAPEAIRRGHFPAISRTAFAAVGNPPLPCAAVYGSIAIPAARIRCNL